MTDAQDVKHRVNDAWRAAAARAYEAAHGVLDAPPVGEHRPWRWVMSGRVAVTLASALVVIAAVAMWWPRAPQGEAVPFPTVSATVMPGGAALQQAPAIAAQGAVTVHVAGAVRSPGLYDLEPGARVAEAIEAAGGATDPSDLNLLNLARLVRDGERIAVGIEHEQGNGLVNLNTASEQELVTLPGVGPVLAARIVEHRETHGPFPSVDDLDAVSGVGPAVLSGLREDATV